MTAAPNLSAATLYGFLRDDFESAWDAMVGAQPDARGNFLFTRQALAILELACRVSRVTGVHLERMSEELEREDARYFTRLPGPVGVPGEFDLPSRPERSPSDQQLLSAVYELGRHGLAHQGQQIPARLADGRYFGLSLGGVKDVRLADVYHGGPRPADHLAFRQQPGGNVWLWIRPEVLFLDFTRAIERSGVFSADDNHHFLDRSYPFNSRELVEALAERGHVSL